MWFVGADCIFRLEDVQYVILRPSKTQDISVNKWDIVVMTKFGEFVVATDLEREEAQNHLREIVEELNKSTIRWSGSDGFWQTLPCNL